MAQEYRILEMVEKIRTLKNTANELREISGGIQAVERNTARMLACIRLLEMDITDAADILLLQEEKPTDVKKPENVLA